MIFKDDPEITMYDLNKQNVGGADVYGLLPDDDVHLNGWFSDYILIREGSTVFNVSDLDLKSRVLIEPCAVLVHAVERAKTTGILRFNSRVVVQGCGPIGLICIAVLRTLSLIHISEPTRRTPISYAVFCLKKKKKIMRNKLMTTKPRER